MWFNMCLVVSLCLVFVAKKYVVVGVVFCVDGGVIRVRFFFFKQKTAYEMRISDWSSDVCSSDLYDRHDPDGRVRPEKPAKGDEDTGDQRVPDQDALESEALDNGRCHQFHGHGAHSAGKRDHAGRKRRQPEAHL